MHNDALLYQELISSKLKTFCKPLKDYFGISLFVYCRIYPNNQHLILSNDSRFNEFYTCNIKQADVFFSNYINVDFQSNYDFVLWPKIPENLCMKSYLLHDYWNGISLLPKQKNNDYYEASAFLSNKDNESINYVYAKHLSALERFVDHFKNSFNDEINIQSNDKRLAVFTQGFNNNTPIKSNSNTVDCLETDLDGFLNAININPLAFNIDNKTIQITKREKQCLQFLDQGYSIKTIGEALSLSPKTIESHLKNIKNKTGLYNKPDLIKLYRNFF